MNLLNQFHRTGAHNLSLVPLLVGKEASLFVATTVTLVSSGTEKRIVDIAKKSLLGREKARTESAIFSQNKRVIV